MGYRLWWRWNDGLTGHAWLSERDLRRLTEEMLAQGMPWPAERLTAAEQGRDVVVRPQELEAALESAVPDPVRISDPKLWQDWLDFLRGAVHRGGLLIRV